MQADRTKSKETKLQFQDAINRVLSMSIVHQKLYEKENLSNIELTDYVQSLYTDILKISEGEEKIKLNIDIQQGKVGMKTLVPLGLILAELISNSIKHAFKKSDEEPSIRLSIQLLNYEKTFS